MTEIKIDSEKQITNIFLKENIDIVNRLLSYKNEFISDISLERVNDIFKDVFQIDVPTTLINDAGHGKEHEIHNFYKANSSALQSLLIFSQVNKYGINIRGHTFDEVAFEVGNDVIHEKSWIDVVLINKKTKEILFIESKFFEFFESNNYLPKPVVRISYLSKNENGYKKFAVTENEFNKIGFKLKGKFNCLLGKTARGHLNDYLKFYVGNKIKHDEEGKVYISSIKGNKYVYSEGIRQILSHLIGISNFVPSNLKNRFRDNYQGYSKLFMTIHNDLPGIGETNHKVLDDYIKHDNMIKNLFTDNGKVKIKKSNIEYLDSMTYQDLYKDNKDYFKDMDKVVSLYKLDKK